MEGECPFVFIRKKKDLPKGVLRKLEKWEMYRW